MASTRRSDRVDATEGSGGDRHLRSQSMPDLVWSFSPWLAFLIASRFTTFSGAVALGFLAAIVVSTRAVTTHRAYVLDWAGLGYFAALGLVLAVTHPGHGETSSRYTPGWLRVPGP
jgi:hypothetical protein